jgi:hypothetical protein
MQGLWRPGHNLAGRRLPGGLSGPLRGSSIFPRNRSGRRWGCGCCWGSRCTGGSAPGRGCHLMGFAGRSERLPCPPAAGCWRGIIKAWPMMIAPASYALASPISAGSYGMALTVRHWTRSRPRAQRVRPSLWPIAGNPSNHAPGGRGKRQGPQGSRSSATSPERSGGIARALRAAGGGMDRPPDRCRDRGRATGGPLNGVHFEGFGRFLPAEAITPPSKGRVTDKNVLVSVECAIRNACNVSDADGRLPRANRSTGHRWAIASSRRVPPSSRFARSAPNSMTARGLKPSYTARKSAANGNAGVRPSRAVIAGGR